jgi:hypothetical protein
VLSKGAGVNQGDAGFEVEGTVLGLNHVNWRKVEKEIKGEGSTIREKRVEMSINGPRWGGNPKMGCLVAVSKTAKLVFVLLIRIREKMSGTLVPL